MLQRRLSQLSGIVSTMVEACVGNGEVPEIECVGDGVFVFDGEVETVDTVSGDLLSELEKGEIHVLPGGWPSGMRDVYMALMARRNVGGAIDISDIACWTGLTESEAQECARWLLSEGKVVRSGNGRQWKCR